MLFLVIWQEIILVIYQKFWFGCLFNVDSRWNDLSNGRKGLSKKFFEIRFSNLFIRKELSTKDSKQHLKID